MEVLIKPIEKSLVLQARGSELVILEEHVAVLKGLKKSKDFIEYFRHTALVNRSARKLFEAWLRKDSSLWKRTYECIGGMEEVEIQKVDSTTPVDKTFVNEEKQKAKAAQTEQRATQPKVKNAEKVKKAKAVEPEKKSAVKKKAAAKKAVVDKPTAKKATKKTAKKTVKKKTTTKKTAKKKTTTTTKKTATKKKTKTTKKK